MDIYLVNSGKSDFYTPPRPLRNALYRNNRDGTFTDVTEKAGVAGGGYGMGVAVGDYNGDGLPRSLRHAVRSQHPLSQQRRRHLHRRDREGRGGCRPDGVRAPSGSTTTMTDGSTSSSASSPSSTQRLGAAPTRTVSTTTASRASSSPVRAGYSITTAMVPLLMSAGNRGSPSTSARPGVW